MGELQRAVAEQNIHCRQYGTGNFENHIWVIEKGDFGRLFWIGNCINPNEYRGV